MKTKEFIRKAKELGYRVRDDGDYLYINKLGVPYYEWILLIEKNTSNFDFKATKTDKKQPNLAPVMKLLVDYVLTPIDERADEDRFYVKLMPETSDSYPFYLFQTKENMLDSIEIDNDSLGTSYEFTKISYSEAIDNNTEWRPFLPVYNSEDTDVFIPVEDGEDE